MTDPATTANAPGDDLISRIQSAGVAPLSTAGQQGAKTPSRYHENISTTSLDDDTVTSSEYEVYKGRKGFTDRLAILLPKKVLGARVHFVATPQGGDSKLGGYLICASKFATQGGQDVPTQLAPCCEKLEVANKRFSALVLQYATDARGGFLRPLSYTLRVWRFNPNTFVALRAANKEFPLDAHDIQVTCTDEQYQKITLQSCKESVAAMPDFRAAPLLDGSGAPTGMTIGGAIDGWVATMLPRLDRTLGKRLTAAEWNGVLFGTGGGPGAMAVSPADTPVESIAQLLGVPPLGGSPVPTA